MHKSQLSTQIEYICVCLREESRSKWVRAERERFRVLCSLTPGPLPASQENGPCLVVVCKKSHIVSIHLNSILNEIKFHLNSQRATACPRCWDFHKWQRQRNQPQSESGRAPSRVRACAETRRSGYLRRREFLKWSVVLRHSFAPNKSGAKLTGGERGIWISNVQFWNWCSLCPIKAVHLSPGK